MSVYVFNILVDYMPNGIDNAQVYREKIFNQIGIDGYYVFTNFPKMRNISLYNIEAVSPPSMPQSLPL